MVLPAALRPSTLVFFMCVPSVLSVGFSTAEPAAHVQHQLCMQEMMGVDIQQQYVGQFSAVPWHGRQLKERMCCAAWQQSAMHLSQP